MKKLMMLLLVLASTQMKAQLAADSYDFWVGEWDLTWTNAQGEEEKGHNSIYKVLDGKVIQENFEALDGAFKGYLGMSISVFNPQSKTWHQTWMDNQGGNINFTGAIVDGNKVFQTAETTNANGQKTQSRMKFYDFTDQGFTWDWESTTDGGKTWKLNWRINYQRAK